MDDVRPSPAARPPEAIIAPHYAMTCERVTRYETVLAVHDTTELRFSGETHREGLGRLGQKEQGFFAHVSLCAAQAEASRKDQS